MSPRRATVSTSLWLCQRCVSWYVTGDVQPNRGPGDSSDLHEIRTHIRRVRVRVADLGGGNVVLVDRTVSSGDPAPCSLCDTVAQTHRAAVLEMRTTFAALGT